MESKQHFQLPNKMGIDGLNPKDQLIYVCIRSFINNGTMEAHPSLQTIAKKVNCSIETVRSSIKRLESKEYISIRKQGRCNFYKFNKLVEFEPMSSEFIENENITFETKAFVAASQQYMFKDIEGVGITTYSNKQLADNLNISEKSVRRYNKELENKQLLILAKNLSRDIETKCNTQTKIYKLAELGQAIIWKLKEHDERISENEEKIEMLIQENKNQKILIQKLMEKIDSLSPKIDTITI